MYKMKYPSNSLDKKIQKETKVIQKTIENGGKFNNISTTYVVISKNSKKKENFIPKIPKPTLTIENPNVANKINPLYPCPSALSIKSQQSNNNHYICPFYSPINQKIPTNNEKIIKFNKSQINIVLSDFLSKGSNFKSLK